MAARFHGGGCPIVLGQAHHLLVEPFDSPPQGVVLPAQPLDLPPQGFDLFGLPPPFRLALRGQQMAECVYLFVPVGLTDSAARVPAD